MYLNGMGCDILDQSKKRRNTRRLPTQRQHLVQRRVSAHGASTDLLYAALAVISHRSGESASDSCIDRMSGCPRKVDDYTYQQEKPECRQWI